MTTHLLVRNEERPSPSRRRATTLIQLRWSDFWLLAGILAGLLALVAIIALAPPF